MAGPHRLRLCFRLPVLWSAWGSLFYLLRFWMQSMMSASGTSLDFSQSINRLISLAVIPSMSFPPALDLSLGFPPDTYSIQQTLYVVKRFFNIFLNFFRIRLTTRIGCCILTA